MYGSRMVRSIWLTEDQRRGGLTLWGYYCFMPGQNRSASSIDLKVRRYGSVSLIKVRPDLGSVRESSK